VNRVKQFVGARQSEPLAPGASAVTLRKLVAPVTGQLEPEAVADQNPFRQLAGPFEFVLNLVEKPSVFIHIDLANGSLDGHDRYFSTPIVKTVDILAVFRHLESNHFQRSDHHGRKLAGARCSEHTP